MKTNIRFFKYDEVGGDSEETWHGEVECTESEFIKAPGVIEYERHTMFENGVDQVCLTKNPFKG